MRNQNNPIAKLDTIRSAAKIEAIIKTLLMDERRLMVIVSDDGEVFAISPDELRATATLAQRPSWVLGTYNQRFGTGNIARDVQLRRMEIVGELA